MRIAVAVGCFIVLAACSTSNDPSNPPNDAGDNPPNDAAGNPPGDAGGNSPDDAGGKPPNLGEVQSGIATYYDADGGGNCSFAPTPSNLDVAAMNHEQYAGSRACGSCVAVKGPKGSVTVRIVDRCPECARGHLDLSEQAFAKIANVDDGRVPITWQTVACNVTGNVAYHYKDGSSQYWTAIQVRNHRVPIRKLELKSGGAFVDVARKDYNYFVIESGAGAAAVTVRITSIDGQVLEYTLPAPESNLTAPGAVQFR